MKKVAIIRRNGLGDLLCAVPLILYLKKRGFSLTLFVEKRNAPLIPFLPDFGEVVVLPPGNKYWNYFKTARKFKGKFDIGISGKTSPMKLMNFFLFWLKAKKRVAYVDKRWHRLLINCPVKYDFHLAVKKHQALKGLNMVCPEIKKVPKDLYPKLFVSDELKEKYPMPFLPSPIVLACASISKEESRLDSSRYAELLNRLHQNFPISVLVMAEKEDQLRAREIAQKLKMPHVLHFPRNFEEFMVGLDHGDLYFVADGGVAHIGAALKKKVVALYGMTSPIEWGPLGESVDTFYHEGHVNYICKEPIYTSLERKLKEVICARKHL